MKQGSYLTFVTLTLCNTAVSKKDRKIDRYVQVNERTSPLGR